MTWQRGIAYAGIFVCGLSFISSIVPPEPPEVKRATTESVGCVFHANRWDDSKTQVVTTNGTFIIQGDVSFFSGRKACITFDGRKYWLEIDGQSRHEVLGL